LATLLFGEANTFPDPTNCADERSSAVPEVTPNDGNEASIADIIGDAEDFRDPLIVLLEKAETDPGIALEAEWLDFLEVQQETDPAEFERIRKLLKAKGCRLSAVDKALVRRSRSSSSNQPAKALRSTGGSSASTISGEIASRFSVTDDGVTYFDPGEEQVIAVCSRLDVVAFTRDPKANSWGRLLEWKDPSGIEHRWAMQMALAAGDANEMRAWLLNGGLEIAPGTKPRNALTAYIQTSRPSKYARLVSRVGWLGKQFVLQNCTIGSTSDEEVIFQPEHESEHLINVSGSVDDWRTNVGRFCVGNSRLLLSVSCAFAGPLLKIFSEEGGGVHFFGTSSIGKTTALLVGGSVIGGGGPNGFARSWRATANGLEAMAEGHNDLTLFLDEMAQMDPREASDVAYLLSNGMGKNRMTRTVMARKTLTWSVMYVSSGEVTLGEHSQTVGRKVKGGAEVRLINLPADAGTNMGIFESLHGFDSPDAMAKRLSASARRYYGAPFLEFLEQLTRDIDGVQQSFRHYRTEFIGNNAPCGAAGEIYRVLSRFALIGFAGELATDFGVTGWAEGDSTDAAVLCFKKWLEERIGGTGAADTTRAINQVRGFIERYETSRFQRLDDNWHPLEQLKFERAGFVRGNGQTREFLFFREVFQAEVCEGFDYRFVANALKERGFLKFDGRHLTYSVEIDGRNGRYFVVSSSVLED
jgi:putative DNA primase/helicase